MTAALNLERILTDPTYAPLLDAIHQATPSHIRDQLDAAHHHTDTAVSYLRTLLTNSRETWTDLTAGPHWLRLDMLDRIAALIAGTANTCLHNPGPHRPQPVFAAACKPNLVTCGECMHLLAQRPGSAADATCDACGHICTGPGQGDGIFPGIARLGLLVFTYGTCGDCHPQPEIPRADKRHRLYGAALP